MFSIFVFSAILLVTECGKITLSLNQGVCLCVNEPNVVAVKDPANLASTIGTLANGACFTSSGGIYHSNGDTYYELKDDSNGQIAWVDSFYLSISPADQCASAHATKQAHHIPNGQALDCVTFGVTYTHGQDFTVHGLQCTCDDGAAICSFTGHNCFVDGLVYQHGSAFSISGRGSCTCSQGSVQCNVGK
ncbi:uncharacterized protein LOC132723283 [Ruditapes philippinarum]|uniref:uncharacterized protein LOC132723283 n=1 Tax=Ruditapes philippinarum TaxID=129788 RepID=UPI00295B4141|nr:uncharacterized protein LOC132723283 [Ruditapes philippinarum]